MATKKRTASRLRVPTPPETLSQTEYRAVVNVERFTVEVINRRTGFTTMFYAFLCSEVLRYLATLELKDYYINIRYGREE